MHIPRMELNQKTIDFLEQEMLIKNAQAHGAFEAWRYAKLRLCENGYRFKNGQRITVKYSNGAKDYIFEKIDWSWMNGNVPVIFAQEILKSGKLSKHPPSALSSNNGGIPWDAIWVVPAQVNDMPNAELSARRED